MSRQMSPEPTDKRWRGAGGRGFATYGGGGGENDSRNGKRHRCRRCDARGGAESFALDFQIRQRPRKGVDVQPLVFHFVSLLLL